MPTVNLDNNLEAAMAMLSLGEEPDSPPPPPPPERTPTQSRRWLALTPRPPDYDEVVPETEARPAHCVSLQQPQQDEDDAFLDAIEARIARAFNDTGLPAPRAAALTGAALTALDQTAMRCPAVRLADVLSCARDPASQEFLETLKARLMEAFFALPRVDPEKAALARALVLAALSDSARASEPDELEDAGERESTPEPAKDPVVGAYILCRVSEAARRAEDEDEGEAQHNSG